jgi:hypothetical protein
MTTPTKVADAMCTGTQIAIGGGGNIVIAGGNEDIGIDVTGPINAAGTLGAGNAGWRVQATNFFVDSNVAWSVSTYVICVTAE